MEPFIGKLSGSRELTDLSTLSDLELRQRGGELLVHDKTAADCLSLFREVYLRHSKTALHIGEYARALVAAEDVAGLAQLANEIDFHAFDAQRPSFMHDLNPLERQIYVEVCIDGCQSAEAIAQLSRAVRYVIERNIPGDLVECGVFLGASIVAIIRTLQSLGIKDRHIWLYDTFEGMPEPQPIDYSEVEGQAMRRWEASRRNDGSGSSNWVYGPIDRVKRNVLITGYPEGLLHFVKGKVEDTVPGQLPEQIALLRLDTDFHSSTKHELDYLYPLAAKGAPISIDDYGAYRGAQVATDEFLAASQEPILLSRIDEHVRMFLKPTTP